MFLKYLEIKIDQGPLSVQVFTDKSYRIYNEAGNILLDSDVYDEVEDINDLPYQDVNDLVSAIVNQTHTGESTDG
jgi:hypothetical protein